MEMFVFFTIPWIFVIALVVMALGVGVSALQFILDHIIIISIILWLPVAWLVSIMWRDRTDDEEKMEWALYPLFLVPAYAAIIQIIVSVMEALENDLFGFFLMFFTVPLEVIIVLVGCMGVAWALVWLYKKVIKSKLVTIVLGALVAAPMTYFLWNLNW